MQNAAITETQRKAAKFAAISFLLMMAAVVYGTFGILLQLVVPGDAAMTAQNILAHQVQFRILIVCYLICGIGTLGFLLSSYVVLKPVSQGLTALGAIFRFVFALIWVVIVLNLGEVMRLLTGPEFQNAAFDLERIRTLLGLGMDQSLHPYYIGLPFWALSSTVFACVWWKSRYIPRGLAGFGVIASVWCVFCSFVYLVFPGFGPAINLWSFDTPMTLFELALSFWLLFKGLSSKSPAAV